MKLAILHKRVFIGSSSLYLNMVLANFAKVSEDQESDIPAQSKPGKLIVCLKIIISIIAFITEVFKNIL